MYKNQVEDTIMEEYKPNNSMGNIHKDYSQVDLKTLDLWELMCDVPMEQARPELIRRGIKIAKDIKDSAVVAYENMIEEEYAKLCVPELTMSMCLEWLKKKRSTYPQAAYFFIYLEQNPNPRNENDAFSVALAILDSNKRPIYTNSEKKVSIFSAKNISEDSIVSFVIPTGNIDTPLINALNGNDSVIIKL